MKNKQSKNRNAKVTNRLPRASSNKSIRMETVEMSESMAYEFTMEFLNEQYKDGGYLGMIQTMMGMVQRYDAVLADAEELGQDENMCRAVGAAHIALDFIPEFRKEMAKFEGHVN